MPAAIPFLVQPLQNLQIQGTSRLTYVSATEVQLGLGVIPLKINGQWVAKAVSAAVALSNSGLSASTVYNVYAYDNAGTITLEASTTARATDSAYGVETKSGDATRTLVGKIRTNGSSEFVDSAAARLVLTWFGWQAVEGEVQKSGDIATTSMSWVEASTDYRVEFLCWGGRRVLLLAEGDVGVGAAADIVLAGLGLDNATLIAGSGAFWNYATASDSAYGMLYCRAFVTPSEGYHTSRFLQRSNGGASMTYFGFTTAPDAGWMNRVILL
jgi:hypothetical protein